MTKLQLRETGSWSFPHGIPKLQLGNPDDEAVAGRGLQPRPKRLTDEDTAVVIENGSDGGATPVPLCSHAARHCH